MLLQDASSWVWTLAANLLKLNWFLLFGFLRPRDKTQRFNKTKQKRNFEESNTLDVATKKPLDNAMNFLYTFVFPSKKMNPGFDYRWILDLVSSIGAGALVFLAVDVQQSPLPPAAGNFCNYPSVYHRQMHFLVLDYCSSLSGLKNLIYLSINLSNQLSKFAQRKLIVYPAAIILCKKENNKNSPWDWWAFDPAAIPTQSAFSRPLEFLSAFFIRWLWFFFFFFAKNKTCVHLWIFQLLTMFSQSWWAFVFLHCYTFI